MKMKMSNVTSSMPTPLTTITTFDQNSEQTGIEPIPPFIANQLSNGIITPRNLWMHYILILLGAA